MVKKPNGCTDFTTIFWEVLLWSKGSIVYFEGVWQKQSIPLYFSKSLYYFWKSKKSNLMEIRVSFYSILGTWAGRPTKNERCCENYLRICIAYKLGFCVDFIRRKLFKNSNACLKKYIFYKMKKKDNYVHKQFCLPKNILNMTGLILITIFVKF